MPFGNPIIESQLSLSNLCAAEECASRAEAHSDLWAFPPVSLESQQQHFHYWTMSYVIIIHMNSAVVQASGNPSQTGCHKNWLRWWYFMQVTLLANFPPWEVSWHLLQACFSPHFAIPVKYITGMGRKNRRFLSGQKNERLDGWAREWGVKEKGQGNGQGRR